MAHVHDFRDDAPLVLTVPGLGNSGAGHWQTIWEAERGDTVRADLGMWDRPHRNSWVTKLNEAIRTAGRPVVLAAHSLGCLAVAWWAALETQPFGHPVAGALLVAPPDVDAASGDARLAAFGPAPKLLLPFPSVVIASGDDPYIGLGRAHGLAKYWGSHFVDAGSIGHINAASEIGRFALGESWLDKLLSLAAASPTSEYAPGVATAAFARLHAESDVAGREAPRG